MRRFGRFALLALLASAVTSFDSDDLLGRKGWMGNKRSPNPCSRDGICLAVGYMPSCDIEPVPAWRDEAGLWQCNETFVLEGGKFVWEGGVLSIEPQHCAPLYNHAWVRLTPHETGSPAPARAAGARGSSRFPPARRWAPGARGLTSDAGHTTTGRGDSDGKNRAMGASEVGIGLS